MQIAARVPFVFLFSGVHHRKDTSERKDSGRWSDVGEAGQPVGTKS